MNIFEKLQLCRVQLQQKELKKSGKNTYSNYDYFELKDFLPVINELFLEHKLFSQINFTDEFASLTIINAEKPDESVHFTSPMAEANLKGAHGIQNAGAVMTYQRRYLYLNALEIVESDVLDKSHKTENKKTEQPVTSSKLASDSQKKLISGLIQQKAKSNGTTAEEEFKKLYSGDKNKMSSFEANALIKKLKE